MSNNGLYISDKLQFHDDNNWYEVNKVVFMDGTKGVTIWVKDGDMKVAIDMENESCKKLIELLQKGLE